MSVGGTNGSEHAQQLVKHCANDTIAWPRPLIRPAGGHSQQQRPKRSMEQVGGSHDAALPGCGPASSSTRRAGKRHASSSSALNNLLSAARSLRAVKCQVGEWESDVPSSIIRLSLFLVSCSPRWPQKSSPKCQRVGNSRVPVASESDVMRSARVITRGSKQFTHLCINIFLSH